MRIRTCRAAALLCLLALAPSLRAADPRPDAAGLVVRVKSVDGLLEDIHYLAKILGKDEEAKQFQQLIMAMGGDKGLKGIDQKRPIGLYVTYGQSALETSVIGLFPIADEGAVLKLLDALNLKTEKDDDGIYTVKSDNAPVPSYFRFANKYAYVTALDKSHLEKHKLMAPGDVLPANDPAMLSVVARLDRIPKKLKEQFLEGFDAQMEKARKEEKPDENAAQRKGREMGLEGFIQLMHVLVADGGAMEARVELDRKAGELVMSASLAGVPGTKLTKQIANLGTAKSLFGGLMTRNSAFHLLTHYVLPEEMGKLLARTMEEQAKQGLAQETDKIKRELGEKLLNAALPSVRAGDFDLGVDLRGPSASKHYTLVGGFKLKNGQEFDKLLRDLLREAPEKDRKKIQLDVEKVGDAGIHRLDPSEDLEPNTAALFGKDAKAYVTFRTDAVLFSFGEDALDVLKEAIALPPKSGESVLVQVSLASIAPLMEKDSPGATKAAEEAFGDSKGQDIVRFRMEGGKAFKMQMNVSAPVLKFLYLANEARKKKDQ